MHAMSDMNSAKGKPSFFFDLAIEQHSLINMYFMVDKCQFSFISAPCVMVKGGHFVVRANLDAMEENQPIIWGTEVNGYFTVRDVNPINCHFSTRLVRLYNGSMNSMYLVFPLPKYVDHNQRRFSRRINIDSENADNFNVWFGNMDGGDMDNLPVLNWYDLAKSSCELAEISSSGLRLDIPEDTPLCTKMAVNNLILLKGNFGTANKSNPIYVLGSIVRKMPNPEMEKVMSLGCQFHSWRKIDPRASKTWFRSDPKEGIGIIAEWIARNYRSITI